MHPQRPTTLSLFARHCPRVLDHYEAGVEYDRSIFAAGTAAHDVLHAYALHGEEAIEPTVRALITTGREGIDSEPPLPPDPVFEGRDLALRHIERCDGVLGTKSARYEAGLGFDEGWAPAKYSEATWFRSRLDVVDVVAHDDEEVFGVGLMTSDYKTSWQAGESTLDTLQLRAQAVALREQWSRFVDEKPDFIRQQVVNLRTGADYHRDLWLEDDGDTLDQWQADIETAIAAANHRPRQARPGVECLGCPYATRCKEAAAWADGWELTADIRESARRYAALHAREQNARKALQASLKGIGSVEGVGYVPKERAAVCDSAPASLWSAWRGDTEVDEGAESLIRGLLSAMKLGATQVRAVAKSLYPERAQKAERDAFAETVIEAETYPRWEVAK